MSDDIVKAFNSDDVAQKNIALRKAHDEIERLRAENERLRDKLTFETEFGVNTFEKMNVNRIEIERLRAREARLREALEKIASAPYPDTRFNGRGMLPDFDGFKPIARAALGEEKK